MRFSHTLVALLAFAAAAHAVFEDDVYRTPMPAGGMDLIQPGYTLRTPGKGWTLISTVPPENGAIRAVERRFGVWSFVRGAERRGSTARIRITQVHWEQELTVPPPPDVFLEKYEFLGGQRFPEEGDRITITPRTVNGASCALARSEIIRRDVGNLPPVREIALRQVCIHPEFPGFAVDMIYEPFVESPDAEAEAAAVFDSLKFAPLPYRVREIRPGCQLGKMAITDGALWAPCEPFSPDARGKVLRIDPAANAVTAAIEVGHGPRDVVTAGGYLWAANLYDHTLSRVDPKTNAVTATVGLSGGPIELLSTAGFVWVEPSSDASGATTYVRIDPATASIDKAMRFDKRGIGIAVGRWIFLSQGRDGVWLRLDGETGAVAGRIDLGPWAQLMHYDGRLLSIEDWRDDEVVLFTLDPDALEKSPVPVRDLDDWVSDTAFWNGEFCVLGPISVRCGPPDGDLVHEVPIEPYAPARLRVVGGSLWVEDWSGHSILRIDAK